MKIELNENEIIAIKIAVRKYLESHTESFNGCVPHEESNIGASLAVYNKMFAAQHGSSLNTCDIAKVPGWLADAGETVNVPVAGKFVPGEYADRFDIGHAPRAISKRDV